MKISNRAFWASVILVAAAAFSFKSRAEDYSYQGQNTGRWQFFTSPRVRRDTFLVDTSAGIVKQQVKAPDDEVLFQAIHVFGAPLPGTNGRYKIFYGVVEADTYMVDTLEGKMWMLKSSPKGYVFDPVRQVSE